MSGCTAQGSRGQRQEWAYEASCSRKEKASQAPNRAQYCCHWGGNSMAPTVTNNPAGGGAPIAPTHSWHEWE